MRNVNGYLVSPLGRYYVRFRLDPDGCVRDNNEDGWGETPSEFANALEAEYAFSKDDIMDADMIANLIFRGRPVYVPVEVM